MHSNEVWNQITQPISKYFSTICLLHSHLHLQIKQIYLCAVILITYFFHFGVKSDILVFEIPPSEKKS